MKIRMLRQMGWALGILAIAVTHVSCGKKDFEGQPVEDGMIPVQGETIFGSQCTLGTVPQPNKARMGLWDCPIGVESLELNQPPSGLVFQADCKKMLITARSATRPGKIDGTWKILPNGEFSLAVEDATVGSVGLTSVGGVGGCTAFPTLEVIGRVDCKDIDNAIIEMDSYWYLAKGKKPDTFSGTQCQLPASCYLHAGASIKQCP